MGAGDVKRRQWSQLLSQLVRSVIVLHLFLGSGSFVSVCATNLYWPSDETLQTIWGAWNKSTPDLNENLAGWNSTQIYSCPRLIRDATIPNWRGVQCLKTVCNYTASEDWCTVEIIGLSVSNASIVGVLPPEIGNFSKLTTLELTGNPRLTGPLPRTLEETWLNVLDVHDNGFNGTIPKLELIWNLLQL